MVEGLKERITLLAAGLLLGALADLLLRAAPWGINLPLWMVAFCGVTAVLVGCFGFGVSSQVKRLAPLALFFAATFAWRDSDTLRLVNGSALCLVVALAALRSQGGSLAIGWVNEYTLGLVREWLAAPLSYVREARLVEACCLKADRRMAGTPLAVARGLLIALPLLLVFGWLFMNADASFEQFIHSLLDFDRSALLNWMLWLPICTVIAGGILLRILQDQERGELASERGGWRLGTVETAIVLGLLNLLFFTFIASQLGYFFGGNNILADSRVLSVAQYARRGFFELAAVTLLVLPLLLSIDWLQPGETAKGRGLFRALSASLVSMLFVIMASAMHRMFLYQQTFGLTELRLYTSVFMVWLALVFLWFLRTVLFDNRHRFAYGALISGFFIIFLLNIANPDGFIVTVNAERAAAGRQFDYRYLSSLSNDAVPALIGALTLADPQDARLAVKRIVARLSDEQAADWRCWNWSTQRAKDAIRSHGDALQRAIAPRAALEGVTSPAR